MSDIEQRKAAALEFYRTLVQDVYPRGIHGYAAAKDDMYIQDLLQPSPQVPDSEVDSGVGALRWVLNRLREKPRTTLDSAMNKAFTSCGTTNGQHLENLWKSLYYKAAQHPQREEWRTMDVERVENMLEDICSIACDTRISKKTMRQNIRANCVCISNIFSPPKAEK